MAPPAALARSCRRSGGHWRTNWAACRCGLGAVAVAGRGCLTLAPPRPLAVDAAVRSFAWTPAETRHLGHDGAPGTWPPAWAPGSLPCNAWHAGSAGTATRAAHRALRRHRWPGLAEAAWELGGTPALPVDYLDVAALRRWWPRLDPDAWVPPPSVHAAWAPWALAPAAPRAARRSCRRLVRQLGATRGELARLLTAPSHGAPRDGPVIGGRAAEHRVHALATRLAAACVAFDHGPPKSRGRANARNFPQWRRPTLEVCPRPGGPDAWRQEQRATAPTSAPNAPDLRWQVLGVGEAVLQRRLLWTHAPADAEPLRLLACYDAAGRLIAWAVAVSPQPPDWAWVWGRAPR